MSVPRELPIAVPVHNHNRYPTMSDKKDSPDRFKTTSQRFGNDRDPQDPFDNPLHPRPHELAAALADTAHLNEKEAKAFVHGHLDRDLLSDEQLAEHHDFENATKFSSYELQGKHYVAEAIWIYELIDAYRHPPIPDECAECGRTLGATFVGDLDKDPQSFRCLDCAGVDPDDIP
jgi:hypothetical protein